MAGRPLAPLAARAVAHPLYGGRRLASRWHGDLSGRDGVVSGCGAVREEDAVAGRAGRTEPVVRADRPAGSGLRVTLPIVLAGGRRP